MQTSGILRRPRPWPNDAATADFESTGPARRRARCLDTSPLVGGEELMEMAAAKSAASDESRVRFFFFRNDEKPVFDFHFLPQ